MSLAAAPLTFNELLTRSGIALSDVLVFRHRPAEPAINRIFEWLVAERPDLFDSYQSTHAPKTEAALSRARYLASFIRHTPKTALFVGLSDVASSHSITLAEALARPRHRELMALGLQGDKASEGRETLLEFQLRPTGWHEDWCGRLVIDWPGLERSWYRWADRAANSFTVRAIAPESLLVRAMEPWDRLTLDWRELAILPQRWQDALAQWRGVYLIIDQQDGKQYVGSAAGADNLLQRWREYGRSGHGGNKLLRARDPGGFRFSILQLTAPDLPAEQVVVLEQSWKLRLRTAAPHGLNEN